jgi:hypothetical protein
MRDRGIAAQFGEYDLVAGDRDAARARRRIQ